MSDFQPWKCWLIDFLRRRLRFVRAVLRAEEPEEIESDRRLAQAMRHDSLRILNGPEQFPRESTEASS
jgi:hypothetical protein